MTAPGPQTQNAAAEADSDDGDGQADGPAEKNVLNIVHAEIGSREADENDGQYKDHAGKAIPAERGDV